MSDRDRLREELEKWFVDIGVTESGGEKSEAALDAGFRMLEGGHTYDEALTAAKRRWEVQEGSS